MISAVVLAAGLSTRMGGHPKALLRLDDHDCFITRIIRTFTAAGIDDIIVVVGHEAARVQDAVARSGLRARCVVNRDYRHGQLSSITAGLSAVRGEDVEAVLLALVDAPLFGASTVRALVQRFHETRRPVVRAVRADAHGHPVLIARSLFHEIERADPDRGAKPIIRAHASPEGDVEVDDEGAFVDVDTPDDYERVRYTAPL